MTPLENKRLLQGIFAELERGNAKPFVGSFADDVRWTIIGSTSWSRTYEGKKAVLDDLLGPLRARLVDRVQVTARRILADEDCVVVEAGGRATTKSGMPYNNTYCWIFELADGQVRAITEYLDTELVAAALGPPANENLRQAVPFFMVTNIDASARFYVDGLGFEMTHRWIDDGTLRWCWLCRGGAAVMLQEFWKDGPHASAPAGRLGEGVSTYFLCGDAIALYRELTSRSVPAKRPFVGNGMWVTSVADPDGYHLLFESPTDAAEETEWSEPSAP
ncbi:MAG TPA: nuclear transport factor 2 family protein [Vicinamibacterales bacterium]|nr:nuclear transport factor 2 family protein [Vicinamibacterales bacterium]